MHDARRHQIGFAPRVVNDKALVRIDNEVMLHSANAEIAGELG